MNTKINSFLLVLLAIFLSTDIFSQTPVEYDYDPAGNRIIRTTQPS